MHHHHHARGASPAYDFAHEDCVTRADATVTRASCGAASATRYDGRRDRGPHDVGVHGAPRPLGRAPPAPVDGRPARRLPHFRPRGRRRLRALGRPPGTRAVGRAGLSRAGGISSLVPSGIALGRRRGASALRGGGAPPRRNGEPRADPTREPSRSAALLRRRLRHQPGVPLLVVLLLALPAALLSRLPRRAQRGGLRRGAPRVRLVGVHRACPCGPRDHGPHLSQARELLGGLARSPALRDRRVPRRARPLLLSLRGLALLARDPRTSHGLHIGSLDRCYNPLPMATYELVVIGSGPAGHHAAVQAAKLGRRAAIIERLSCVGGVCINTGTIPSKTLREAVLYLSGFRQRGLYGHSYRVKQSITIQDLMFRCHHVIERENDVYRAQFARNRIDVLEGQATFVEFHAVKVEGTSGTALIQADQFVIATGTVPAVSPDVPVDGTAIIDADGIFGLASVPGTMIVVGAGVIGMEYACMFATLGAQVTVVETRKRLLEFADGEIIEALMYHMRENRVTFRCGEFVERVERDPAGGVTAYLKSQKTLHADVLLYAVGRQGNTATLGLEAAGLEADPRGRIRVNGNFQTTVPHIYAAGDVIGFPSLASVSMEQGRVASAGAFGIPTVTVPALFPYGLYTIPEISFVGRTEEELTNASVPYEVGMAHYREIARGQIIGDTTGRLKILFHMETGALLGVHVIGQAVMALGGTIRYFAEQVFNYPTLAECYKVAALAGLNKLGRERAAAIAPALPQQDPSFLLGHPR